MYIVAVDESGDLGNKLENGSSRFLVYCFVKYKKDYEEIIIKNLDKLSEEVYKNVNHEFHFTNESYRQRESAERESLWCT